MTDDIVLPVVIHPLMCPTLAEVDCGSSLGSVCCCHNHHSCVPCCSVPARNGFHVGDPCDTPSEVATGTISGVGNGTTSVDHWAYVAGCEIAARERCM